MWLISQPRRICIRAASCTAGRLVRNHTSHTLHLTSESRWEAILTCQREHQRVDETAITRVRRLGRQTRHGSSAWTRTIDACMVHAKELDQGTWSVETQISRGERRTRVRASRHHACTYSTVQYGAHLQFQALAVLTLVQHQ